MKTDTPQTDAKAQFFGFNPEEGEEFVQADFARKLERENAELKADNAMLRQMLDLTFRIPDMSDSELKQLIQNCKAVNDSAQKEQP